MAAAPVPNFQDAQSRRVMALLDGQSCADRVRAMMVEQVAQATPAASPVASPAASPFLAVPTPSPVPTASPSPSPTPFRAGAVVGPGIPFATPFPVGTSVTPPPIPTPTPVSTASAGPVFLVRSSAPPSIPPAHEAMAQPSPSPAGVPTLRPGYVAVESDKLVGSTKPGIPGDAIGNVHIFYQDEVLVGDRAHYDGFRTITVTGNPYIVNNTKNSIYYADKIVFDTISNTAELYNGRGESSQGVERGLVYFDAKDLHSDEHGVAHGTNAMLTTCDRPRAGYHVTGKTIDIIPSDRIVISKAVLWLGAAAVFYLPRVVIPLRTVTDERQRPQFFPEIGYNSYQGGYIKTRLSFGHDQYYYGYYTLEFYTKQGITIGYDGTINNKHGKRSTTISVHRVQDRVQGNTSYNAALADSENFSQNLRAQLGFNYTSAYGPYTNFPPTSTTNLEVLHNKGTAAQTYSFSQNTTSSQASNTNFGFSDTRSFGLSMQNSFTASLSRSQNNYGGFFSENSTGTVTDLLHWSSRVMDYQLTYAKSFAKTPFGINKEPELQIRPLLFLQHFIFPIAPTLTVGEYNEPQTPETTGRADLAVNAGPLLLHAWGSDFSANVNVNQFYYGTGDLKASIQQILSLTTPVGTHFINNITYNEQNYNGPASVPFATIDLQPTMNVKNANDIMRFFNSDIYNFTLGFSTSFDGIAQPVTYQLAGRPSTRSYAALTGTYNPGPGQGFYSTNAQFSTPFGRGAWIQFVGDIDWKNKARIENKSIYYSRIIGDCYEIQLQYNQDARSLNATIFLLAFPSQAASFGLTSTGSIIPSSINGYGTYYNP